MMRIGLVGQGPVARTHARSFAELSDIEVVAATGEDEAPNSSAERVRDDAFADVPSYDTTVTMYEDAGLDAVAVCTPPNWHRKPVTAAAERDLDVLCPGALAKTLGDGDAIADAVTATGITFVGGYVTRFAPEYKRALDRVRDGEIGRIGNVRTFRRDYRRETGDVVGLLGHDVEFLRRVCGDVDHAFARRVDAADGAYALATLRFENDVVGHLDVRQDAPGEASPSPTRPDGPTHRFELSGTDGLIEFDSESVAPVILTGANANGSTVPLQRDGHCRHVEHFRDCLAGDTQSAVPVEEALGTLRVCTAVREAADRGTPVAPAEVSA
jgi:predicted dehydrogenase